MTDSQTGRTTQQMLDAPIGAVYVWCNSRLTYPKMLAHGLQRDDLMVKPLSWLEPQNVCARGFVGVVIDHAATLGGWQAQDAMRYLRDHGVLVTVDSAHVRPTASAGGANPLISLPDSGRRDWIRTNRVSDSRGSEGEKANGTDPA